MNSLFWNAARFDGELTAARSWFQKGAGSWFTAVANSAVAEVVERLAFNSSQRRPAHALLLGKVCSNFRIERRVRARVVASCEAA